MKNFICLAFFCFLLFNRVLISGQQGSLYEFREIKEAIEKGTRTREGAPGARYWQNSSDYKITATLDTGANTVTGFATIRYHNNSPDSLRGILFRLYQDLYKKGSPRMEPMEPSVTTEGVTIDSLKIDGVLYIKNNMPTDSRQVNRYGTILYLRLKELIRKKSVTSVEVSWKFTIPDGTAGSLDRTGRYGEAVFMGLWYPQVAVYDDVYGWDREPHLGSLEFYNDFNNFDVEVKVPEGYVVWATGECVNMEEVLNGEILRRYNLAKTNDTIIDIIRKKDYPHNVVKGNQWHFKAEHVPDFAFATAPGYLWQGTSVVTDKASNRRVLLDIASPDTTLYGFNSLDVFRKAIIWAQDSFPGVPFPYAHSTIFLNGSMNKASMEYPMLVNNSSYSYKPLHNAVIVHEAYHCYMPFYMGFNETRYMWMDEGFTNLNEHKFRGDGISLQATEMISYPGMAGKSLDYPLMFFKAEEGSGFFSYMIYLKPCLNLMLLETLLGKNTFLKATQEFMHNWNGKHPTPYDMFYSYSKSANQDLSWFWKPYYFEPGYADVAIKTVDKKFIIVENLGTLPVPVDLEITFTDNTKETVFANLDIWKTGRKEYEVKLKGSKTIKSVKLGSLYIPDINTNNNKYPKK